VPETEEISGTRWDLFFGLLAKSGIPFYACQEADIDPIRVHELLKRDDRFRERFEICREVGLGALEAEAFRRAVHGYDQKIFDRGVVVGFQTVYSDNLLQFLMKANIPKYRDRLETTSVAPGRPKKTLSTAELQAEVDRRLRNFK
jgi:hypothetical protein